MPRTRTSSAVPAKPGFCEADAGCSEGLARGFPPGGARCGRDMPAWSLQLRRVSAALPGALARGSCRNGRCLRCASGYAIGVPRRNPHLLSGGAEAHANEPIRHAVFSYGVLPRGDEAGEDGGGFFPALRFFVHL